MLGLGEVGDEKPCLLQTLTRIVGVPSLNGIDGVLQPLHLLPLVLSLAVDRLVSESPVGYVDCLGEDSTEATRGSYGLGDWSLTGQFGR